MKLPSTILCLVGYLSLIVSDGNVSFGAASLQFAGSQADLNPYETWGSPPCCTVSWRQSKAENIYATGPASYPNQWYGKEGYALFAAPFTYPDGHDSPHNSFIPTDGSDPFFPNVIDLPDWISDSKILTQYLSGGYASGLLQDPVLMNNGEAWWTFDGVNYPPPDPNNITGVNPYVQQGFLNGLDIYGNDPLFDPTGRWGFTVGANPPAAFRIGVITAGDYSNALFSPDEVFLQQFADPNDPDSAVGSPVSTGILSGDFRGNNKTTDMHFFDIYGAEEGDNFAFLVTAGSGSFGVSGISGFSFDVLPDIDADFNDDNVVNGQDFLILQRGFGVGTTHAEGDADFNGVINSADIAIWENFYGTVTSNATLATVPEPTTVILFGMGGLAILGLRRRA